MDVATMWKWDYNENDHQCIEVYFRNRRIEVPSSKIVFITYAVITAPVIAKPRVEGSWSVDIARRALLLMYSALARSQNELPLLYVYSNVEREKLVSTETTFGTKMNIVWKPFVQITSSYKDPLKELSRSKLDLVAAHLSYGETPIWIDLHTLVFMDLSKFVAKPFVIGWAMDKSVAPRKILEVDVDPRSQAQGDLWFMDGSAVKETLALEATLTNIPEYDLEGYFSIMLHRNKSRFSVLQELSIEHSFGFECLGKFHGVSPEYPYASHMNITWKSSSGFVCHDKPLGVLSFTAPKFKELFLEKVYPTFQFIKDYDSRRQFHKYFYNTYHYHTRDDVKL
jgi:hypothetical protein